MMVIAIVPSFFLKPTKPVAPIVATADSVVLPAPTVAPATAIAPVNAGTPRDTIVPIKDDTVLVTSPLYVYGITTRGGRVVRAELPKYVSRYGGAAPTPVELVRADLPLLDGAIVIGRDSIALSAFTLTASVPSLTLTGSAETLTLTGTHSGIGLELQYRFRPDDYRFDVGGTVTGVGPNGGLMVLTLGNGLAESEKDTADNHRAFSLVTKQVGSDAERSDFAKLDAGATKTFSGPFEWAAVKSKYFVAAVLASDSSARLAGVSATTSTSAGKRPVHADVRLSLPIPTTGRVAYTVYAGPLEYRRLKAIGHDFDDVNPYGYPGFRTLIRFFSAPVRWLLLFMHEQMGVTYGIALVLFGILIRVVLWPLNQKAMRSSMHMQAIQPELQAIQARHKNDPQKAQQEQMRLFKEHGVNPLGGCWPMLLPYPVMIALWFVFQYTIELRGVSFLWLPDLSRPDPFYVIPVLMGASMFGLSKMGQLGMAPNPQMKTMLYFMPVMLTVMFVSFPAGLNLYYLVSNIASIPQQWLLARDRMRRTNNPVLVGTKK
jgi:YidC/Oxa1 family membrane protein insertase